MRLGMGPRGSATTEEIAAGELDLGAIGRALMRRKWWIVVPTILAAVLAFVAVSMIPPRYKSEARILVGVRESVFLRPEAERVGDADRSAMDPEAIASQVQLILSRDLALQVINKLKLGELPEFDPVLGGVSPMKQLLALVGLVRDPLRTAPEDRVLEAYFQRLTVYPVDRSRVIVIEFYSQDPDLAAKVTNAIADGYLVVQQRAKQEGTRAASQWLATEIEAMRQKVAEAEAKVEDYRSKSNLFVGANNTTLASQQLSEVNTQLSQARAQRAEAEAKAQLIRGMLQAGRPIEATDVLNSEIIRRLTEQRVTARAQLAEQSSTLLPGHPRIKELTAQINDLDRQLRQEANTLARAFENDARLAGARAEALANSLDQLKKQVAATSDDDVHLRALEREAKAQRDLLEAYLVKYREATARDSPSASPADARIISRAVAPHTPYFPKTLPIVLIVALTVLALTSGLIATNEVLSGNVFVFPEQPAALPVAAPIEARMAVREVPPPAAEPPPPSRPAALAEKEVFAAIRAAGAAAKRVVVTGEGAAGLRLEATLRLARALSVSERVIMLDLSFEEPGLASIAADAGVPGLSELVAGLVAFGPVIGRDRGSPAHVILAGHGGEPETIANSPRLRLALEALAQTYDRVVIHAGRRVSVEAQAALANVLIVTEGVGSAALLQRVTEASKGGSVQILELATAKPADAAAA